MLPIGVATTYNVPGPGAGPSGRPRAAFSPATGLLLGLSLMAVIVGAACQPLQPPPASTTATTAMPSADATTLAPAAPARAPLVALVVPLSGRQEALGTAVRDGFIAGTFATPEGRRFDTLVIDEARVSAAEAYRQALEAGARVLVGPLLKESVQALAPLAGATPGQLPVLALNNLADGDPATGSVWQFGLAPEDEAREVAARAAALGQRRALVLVPASEWGQRLFAAFGAEFAARGGVIVDSRTYVPGAADYSSPIRALLMTTETRPPPPGQPVNPGEKPASGPGRRQDADLIFVAANGGNGRQIVPQLKFFGGADLPTYSTSAIWDDGEGDAEDLNGVVFPDGPWVLEPDGRATGVKNALVRHWGRQVLGASRLYALGYDACGLVPEILARPAPGSLAGFNGATGILSADASGRLHRSLSFAEVRGGRAVPLPSVATLLPPAIDATPPGAPR